MSKRGFVCVAVLVVTVVSVWAGDPNPDALRALRARPMPSWTPSEKEAAVRVLVADGSFCRVYGHRWGPGAPIVHTESNLSSCTSWTIAPSTLDGVETSRSCGWCGLTQRREVGAWRE